MKHRSAFIAVRCLVRAGEYWRIFVLFNNMFSEINGSTEIPAFLLPAKSSFNCKFAVSCDFYWLYTAMKSVLY